MGLSPLEAMAAILVQHGEVIAVCYTEAGTIAAADSYAANLNSVLESDIPDSTVPINLFQPKVNHAHKVYSPEFAATTNSTKVKEYQGKNPHNLRVIKSGVDLWHGFKDRYWWAYALL